jgi:hypothetical protein
VNEDLSPADIKEAMVEKYGPEVLP